MTFARFAIPALVLLTTATGCELITGVDADKIKDDPTTTATGSGGSGGDSSSTTGTGGTGGATTGTGGAGGVGGATTSTGGAGGTGGNETGGGGCWDGGMGGGCGEGAGGSGGVGGSGVGGAGGAGGTATGTGGAGGTATGTGGAGGATSTTGAGGAGGAATGTGGAGGATSTTGVGGAGGAGGATTSTTSTTSGAGGSGGTTTTTTTTGGGGLVVDGGACAEDEQCESQVCASDVCQAPSCVDGVQNGEESDVDCGLTCAGDDPLAYCPSGATCVDNDDCYNAHCVSGVCAVSAEGDLCLSDADCDSGLTCDSGATGTCVAPAPITSCANGLTNQVVVSQVYGAGGMGNFATYSHDFIELHNRGGAAVSLTGWSVQYASATGTTWEATTLSGNLEAGHFYLIKLGTAGGSTSAVLPTADATGTTNLDALNGKVALVSSTTAVTGACPTEATLVDMVGYGPNASVCPGVSGTSPALTGGASAYRKEKNVACLDTNAGSDFTFSTSASARNSATTAVVCVDNCTSTPTP